MANPAEEQPAWAMAGRLGASWDHVLAGFAMAGCAIVWAGFDIDYQT
jgi:hypothetical protein